MSGVVPRTGQVSMSCINAVRRCKTNQQSRIVNNPNTYASGSQNFYRGQAAMRGFVADDGLKFSEFRGAQILTACIRTQAETYRYFYGDNDDGRIYACIQPNTVSVNPTARYYGYRLNGSAYQICTNNNFKTWYNLQGGGPAPGTSTQYSVYLKDNTTGAFFAKNVLVNYNGPDRLYTCIQGKDGTFV